MTDSLKLTAVVLAAGGSRRLGQPKQLLESRGRTLLEQALQLAQGVCSLPVVVVLGAHAERLQPLLDPELSRVVVNEEWQAGLAGSLQLGLSEVPAEADGVLIMLCDQPELEQADLNALVAGWHSQPQAPAAARFDDLLGAPAIVPASLCAELQNSLQGDTGAAAWLRGRGDVTAVSMQNAALDLDTPDDLARLRTE